MGEKIIQPPFYNSGFYDTGAGGGGDGEFVEIGGDVYKVVDISGKKVLTENLKYYGNGINYVWGGMGTSNLPAGRPYFAVDSYNNVLYNQKGGVYYNRIGRDWIVENLDLKGFHVMTRTEFQSIINELGANKVKSSILWNTPGTNESGFNLLPTGYIDGSSYNTMGVFAGLWNGSQNDYYGLNNSGTVSGDKTTSKCLCIRLCM